MIEFEITNETLEKAEERLYQMERSAKVAFEVLFPNLDFEKDFLQNQNIVDIAYLLGTVEKVEDGRDDPNFVALYQLLEWDLEGEMHELSRKQAIETIRNWDENEVNVFISWLQKYGLSYEEARDSEYQIEMLASVLDDMEE